MMDYNDEKIIVYIMQSIFSVVGTIGNSLVLYIYLRKKDKSTSSIFILALAGADFFTCLVIVPYNIVTLYLDYKHGFDVMCRIYMFLITGGVPYATLIMVAIAFDRYFCICHPFLHVITIFRAKLIIFILLGFSGILGVLVALMYGINDHVPVSSSATNRSCSFNTSSLNEAVQCNSTIFEVNSSSEISHPYEYGMCLPNYDIFNEDFVLLFSKIHAILYLIMFTFVVVLYSLIYREIHVRRARKAKRKRSSLFPSQSCAPEASMAETQLTLINVPQSNGNAEESVKNDNSSKLRKIGANLKEKQFYANIRTAAMLFIVTIVFLIAFLPALLMTQTLIPYNIVFFYTYFVYNTANPVIYSFMNKSFRTELKNLYGKVCKNNRKQYK
ncbi:orexin receptor type 2-like [Ostrea edulis]|uniref:orexin receptor type 2-like n=1 Tax=Ostrea edulis TaxID=37623 RepID=UPI002095DEDD|nr:orexin receptor type 2-like [Ostrea edulis]XP_048729677.1 orexin receptor type 2-like [Ostrea edulis]XP_048729683.1 orexin receptor type 2-like [Ostrea edulis]